MPPTTRTSSGARPAARTHPLLCADAALWAEHAAGGGAGGEGAWCAGWVRLGRAAVPYSVRLLPGTLRRAPHQLQYVHTGTYLPYKTNIYLFTLLY